MELSACHYLEWFTWRTRWVCGATPMNELTDTHRSSSVCFYWVGEEVTREARGSSSNSTHNKRGSQNLNFFIVSRIYMAFSSGWEIRTKGVSQPELKSTCILVMPKFLSNRIVSSTHVTQLYVVRPVPFYIVEIESTREASPQAREQFLTCHHSVPTSSMLWALLL